MKKRMLLAAAAVCLACFPAKAEAETEIETIDRICPATQKAYIEAWADYYDLSPEVVQALIFCESSYSMDAVNPASGCYGIAQINPNVWGYGYDTEEKQIQKCCEMLSGFVWAEQDIAYALASYNGQSGAYSDLLDGTNTEDEFVSKVLRISYELEELHGKHDY